MQGRPEPAGREQGRRAGPRRAVARARHDGAARPCPAAASENHRCRQRPPEIRANDPLEPRTPGNPPRTAPWLRGSDVLGGRQFGNFRPVSDFPTNFRAAGRISASPAMRHHAPLSCTGVLQVNHCAASLFRPHADSTAVLGRNSVALRRFQCRFGPKSDAENASCGAFAAGQTSPCPRNFRPISDFPGNLSEAHGASLAGRAFYAGELGFGDAASYWRPAIFMRARLRR